MVCSQIARAQDQYPVLVEEQVEVTQLKTVEATATILADPQHTLRAGLVSILAASQPHRFTQQGQPQRQVFPASGPFHVVV